MKHSKLSILVGVLVTLVLFVVSISLPDPYLQIGAIVLVLIRQVWGWWRSPPWWMFGVVAAMVIISGYSFLYSEHWLGVYLVWLAAAEVFELAGRAMVKGFRQADALRKASTPVVATDGLAQDAANLEKDRLMVAEDWQRLRKPRVFHVDDTV